MEHLDLPSELVWTARRKWFEDNFDIEARGGGYVLGEHALGLLVELQSVYCAGAFITSILLACTIIDAHLREIELPRNFSGGIKAAFESNPENAGELDWLRRRRNELIHFNSRDERSISVDDHFANRAVHERDAQRAIGLVSELLFLNPWV